MLAESDVIAGRFLLERLSRTGASGSIFRARDTQTGTIVAIKVLSGLTRSTIDRFTREALLLADLAHPGIVRYIAHGTASSGERYLVMEWLEGYDLAERLAPRVALTLDESVTLAKRVAEALSVAHARGVVHRDIKPANLFLPNGDVARVKVLDFGIAGLTRTSPRLTRAGALVGTPGYMAPEQVRGLVDLDPRVDVFALGCVLFECVAGRPVFDAEHDMAVLAKILLEEAPRLQQLRAEVPSDLDDLVTRMLAKDPAERPVDGSALIQELATQSASIRPAPRRSSRPPTLTANERRLVSIVLADTGEDRAAPSGTAPTLVPADAEPRLHALREAARPFDARVERLADGSIVAMVLGGGTVAEQAVRAARCALSMRSHLDESRIVLATGRVVVEEETLPVGEAIDRAVRLLQAAPSGAVSTDEATASLLGARFDVESERGALIVRGEREGLLPVRTLLGKPTACIGRDWELSMLEATLRAAASEPTAHVVLVTAPAGMGKTRLRQELIGRIQERGDDIGILLARGDPMSAASAFGMVGPMLRRAATILEDEDIDTRRAKLRKRLGQHLDGDDLEHACEFLGELAGVPLDDTDRVRLRSARNEPLLMGDRMRAAWEDWLTAECAAHPVLLVLDDLHWGDLPTVHFVDAALERLHEAPLMVLALARPEVRDRFPDLWADRELTEVKLSGLSRKAAERIVRGAIGDDVPQSDLDRMIARAEGNAFYLEELVRAQAEGTGDRMPDTVLGMVQARLDALEPDARQVLRAASVFGRTFWAGGVTVLLGGARREPMVAEWLEDLCAHEVVMRRPQSVFHGHEEYAFRHDLVREAAYATLTEPDRVLGHLLAGRWLERAGERDPVVLAEHYERGAEATLAVSWYQRAAEDALEGNDIDAAKTLATRAFALDVKRDVRGHLMLVLAEACRWKDELVEAEQRALEAASCLSPRTASWYRAAGELAAVWGPLGRIERLREWASRLSELAPERGSPDSGAYVVALCRMSAQLIACGVHGLADELIARATTYAGELARTDPYIAARLQRVQALRAIATGDLGRALDHVEAARQSFERAGDTRDACLELATLAEVYLELGLPERAAEILSEALAVAERMRLGYVLTYGGALHALAVARSGDVDGGKQMAERALSWFGARGGHRIEGSVRLWLAEILDRAGETRRALAEVKRAIEVLGAYPSRRARALALLARIELGLHQTAEALVHARQANEIVGMLGGAVEGEGAMRLVYADALAASGEEQASSIVLAEARTRLHERASRIASPELRERFMKSVPEHARTLDS